MEHKLIKEVLLLVASVLTLVLSGCGGSDTTRENDSSYVSGGTDYAPATMSLERGNKVVENAYYNFFAYEALAGEKLSLEAILKKGITDSQREECLEGSDTFIVVYDESLIPQEQYRTCTSRISLEFAVSGKYIFQIKYPGNMGYFSASSES